MKELVAYRTVDTEGDVWAEHAFVFDSQEKADEFFNEHNLELKKYFTDSDPGDKISDFEIFKAPSGHITMVRFHTDYAGLTTIKIMGSGFYIPN